MRKSSSGAGLRWHFGLPARPRLKPRLQAQACSTLLLAMIAAGCRQDMHDQPRYKPLAASEFFPDGRSARPIPAGTVAIDELQNTDPFYTGYTGNDPANFMDTIPTPITAELLQRGQERFDIFCSPCHDRLGTGHGMIERRGFKIPADLDSDRIRQAPPGYVFQVISNGYGAMPDHRDQIPAADRWAIVAYIRALQLSRSATVADVPAQNRSQLGVQ